MARLYLTLVRGVRSIGKNAIIGHLYINDEFFCTTLENYDCSIPNGIYSISLTYSPKFKRMLPWLNVPKRSGIRIHAGNTSADSRGCILVGDRNDYFTLYHSRDTLDKLIKRLFADNHLNDTYLINIR